MMEFDLSVSLEDASAPRMSPLTATEAMNEMMLRQHARLSGEKSPRPQRPYDLAIRAMP